MNDFHRDNDWQREKRDKILSGFYGTYGLDGRYVYIDKSSCSALIQKRLAVDTVLQSKKGGSVCIEEKIVRWPRSGRPHDRFCLEVQSCTKPGYESDGWMVYGEADYLLYAFETQIGDLDCYLMPFAPLKAWFWPVAERYHLHVMPDTLNRTASRLVPTTDVAGAVDTKRFLLGEGGVMLWQDARAHRGREAA